MSWTAEQIELLKKLAAAGASGQQIADELGCGLTRSAVIGKAKRDGIPMAEGRPSYVPTITARPRPLSLEAATLRAVCTVQANPKRRLDLSRLGRSLESKKPVTLAKLNLPAMAD